MSLAVGTRLGPYEITSLLGSGGMGEVYRAKDHKLGRDIAIKVLREELATDPERLKRFEQEARSASALNHPNIITIHDIGKHEATPYIAMELVEGRTLRDIIPEAPLPTKKLLQLATQTAEGLAKAHSAGIIHRDLKPENLMVTSDGYVKILDFGLAKLLPQPTEVGSEMTTRTRDTREGVILGTLQYMSPEQAASRPIDFRSDQFTLGSILYEMATGKLAFQRETVPQTLTAIIEDDPEPINNLNPKLPAPLRWIVERCLSKEPDERYGTTHDLAKELRGLRDHLSEVFSEPYTVSKEQPSTKIRRNRILASVGLVAGALALVVGLNGGGLRDRMLGVISPTPIESLAVLPLENLSGDPEQEYFADGMTEQLITELAQIRALKVISRTSVMRYKGARTPLPEIAKELDVDGVIVGSALRVEDRVRITAQLIHAETDEHLWAESYERELKDILTLQSEVARAIAGEIRVAMTETEEARLAHTRPVNPEAYEAFLLGRHHRDKLTPTDMRQAIAYFQQAIELDPDFALPYTYLAHALVLAGGATGSPWIPPRERMERAKAAANKALEIDPQLSEAHAALGVFLTHFELDWSAAERAFQEAIALNPGSAETRHLFAVNLSRCGRHQEAISEMKRALELDPFNLQRKSTYGLLLYVAGRYDEAIHELQTVLALNPDFPQAHRFLGVTYLEKEMHDEAIVEFQQAVALAEGNSLDLSYLGLAYVAGGRTIRAEEILQELEQRSTEGPLTDVIASFHMHWMLGDMEKAFYWLERAIDERVAMVTWLKVTPFYDPLRSDPRFQDLLSRLNFPE